MQTKKENYWFTLKLLLLMNVAVISAILLFSPGAKTPVKTQQSCNTTESFTAEALNAVIIKLM